MNPLKALNTYLRASVAELKKVAWPTKEETIRYSVLVTVVSIATALFFATLDYGFRTGLNLLVTASHQTTSAQNAPATPHQPITPNTEPFAPTNGSGIEAVDGNGNPTQVNVKSIPLDSLKQPASGTTSNNQ